MADPASVLYNPPIATDQTASYRPDRSSEGGLRSVGITDS